jgi:hypothetical protein
MSKSNPHKIKVFLDDMEILVLGIDPDPLNPLIEDRALHIARHTIQTRVVSLLRVGRTVRGTVHFLKIIETKVKGFPISKLESARLELKITRKKDYVEVVPAYS